MTGWLTLGLSVLLQGLIGLVVIFKVGRYVGQSEERAKGIEIRVEHLESKTCPHQECPLRMQVQMHLDSNG